MGKMKAYGPAMCAPSTHESCDVSVRKIDNGYIVRESRSCGDRYSSSEMYCPEKPDLDVYPSRGPDAGQETLRGAMKELRKR